jgi:hypothetical protein
MAFGFQGFRVPGVWDFRVSGSQGSHGFQGLKNLVVYRVSRISWFPGSPGFHRVSEFLVLGVG